MTGKPVTAATAKAMRDDRAAGMTLKKIAAKYDLSMLTVLRHTSDKSAEKLRQSDRARYFRMKEDPERYAEHKAKKRKYFRAYRQKNRC